MYEGLSYTGRLVIVRYFYILVVARDGKRKGF